MSWYFQVALLIWNEPTTDYARQLDYMAVKKCNSRNNTRSQFATVQRM